MLALWRRKLRMMLKIAVSTGTAISLLALSACGGGSSGTTATVNNYQNQGLPAGQSASDDDYVRIISHCRAPARDVQGE